MSTSVKNLKVYTTSCQELDVTKIEKEDKFLGSGYVGFAYLNKDNKVIKLLDKPGTKKQYEVMSFIKNLNLPNFYLIYDILSNEKFGVKTYAGTISKYYKSENIDLWEMPSSFIVDNVKKLFEQASILGEKKISMCDIHDGNLIISREGIISIDADDDRFCNECRDKENINAVRFAIIKLLASNYFKRRDKVKIAGSEIVKKLCEIKSFDEISKYKSPIDWFNDNIKRIHK